MWAVVVGVAGGLLMTWAVVVTVLYLLARRERDSSSLRDAARLVPDVVRLVRRLAVDPDLPRGIRWRLWGLLVYLVLPIDLVPDVIPVVGYADDALVVVLTLRSVVRAAGPEALERHWTGTPEGLAILRRLVG